ncbi:NAD(P)/FAD-dependent oxidoreductase [Dactylosporangium sp. CA-233914]|uniref:NAD(P)/FAD-dependent oxidoreductase n=1 Tax=Dactylosporangium sp. CA-233914 TaxID=3239934 RepID=UPI003D8E1808
MLDTALIIGASVAGTRVATDLRRHGYRGRVLLVDAQDELPYDRPPLSKSALTGDRIAPVRLLTADAAAAAGIELRLGAAAGKLDTDAAVVTLTDGTELRFDELVIATGARARPTPWPRHERIVELRTLEQARHLHTALRSSRHIAVVGAGFIGAEVASAARSLGLRVSLIDPVEVPVGRLFGDALGRRFHDLHSANGVSCHFGIGVESLEPHDSLVEVTLGDGTRLTVDIVVVGIGVEPDIDWLAGSGVVLDDGVLCDSRCRAVGHRNIRAAGDVARWFHPRHGKPIRVEHWTNAVEQAQFVAAAIARPDDGDEFAPVEYVWSDQYDWKIQIAGVPQRQHEPIVIPSPRPAALCALWCDGHGVVVGGLSVNWPKAAILMRRAIASAGSAEAIRAALA